MYCFTYLLLNSASFETQKFFAWFVKEKHFAMEPVVSFCVIIQNFWVRTVAHDIRRYRQIGQCLELLAVSSLNISIHIVDIPICGYLSSCFKYEFRDKSGDELMYK